MLFTYFSQKKNVKTRGQKDRRWKSQSITAIKANKINESGNKTTSCEWHKCRWKLKKDDITYNRSIKWVLRSCNLTCEHYRSPEGKSSFRFNHQNSAPCSTGERVRAHLEWLGFVHFTTFTDTFTCSNRFNFSPCPICSHGGGRSLWPPLLYWSLFVVACSSSTLLMTVTHKTAYNNILLWIYTLYN